MKGNWLRTLLIFFVALLGIASFLALVLTFPYAGIVLEVAAANEVADAAATK